MRLKIMMTIVALMFVIGGFSLAPSVARAHCGTCHHGPKAKKICDKCRKAGKKTCGCKQKAKKVCDHCRKAGKKVCGCKHK